MCQYLWSAAVTPRRVAPTPAVVIARRGRETVRVGLAEQLQVAGEYIQGGKSVAVAVTNGHAAGEKPAWASRRSPRIGISRSAAMRNPLCMPTPADTHNNSNIGPLGNVPPSAATRTNSKPGRTSTTGRSERRVTIFEAGIAAEKGAAQADSAGERQQTGQPGQQSGRPRPLQGLPHDGAPPACTATIPHAPTTSTPRAARPAWPSVPSCWRGTSGWSAGQRRNWEGPHGAAAGGIPRNRTGKIPATAPPAVPTSCDMPRLAFLCVNHDRRQQKPARQAGYPGKAVGPAKPGGQQAAGQQQDRRQT